ncbi:hypothetical protein G6N74_10515 [Mesorhizobium sp. CGMCC 1.15528]|uniref:Uncharacterized protein n=1 Tax=Mesorhizobium zhangyense TaxID=1776730 RepID=A0A7C9R6U8_9HYPH|nr:hypothetical protein [Mesorhizobium zhangyense]NGN41502.1 hypothetical protein [Mesorhizobium zhangyense]
MIVEYSSGGGLRLTEAEDFRKFKVLLKGAFGTTRPYIDGLTFVDDDNALVGMGMVPALAGTMANEQWRTRFNEMVAAAAKHGWLDADSNAIRAHVERQD